LLGRSDAVIRSRVAPQALDPLYQPRLALLPEPAADPVSGVACAAVLNAGLAAKLTGLYEALSVAWQVIANWIEDRMRAS